MENKYNFSDIKDHLTCTGNVVRESDVLALMNQAYLQGCIDTKTKEIESLKEKINLTTGDK
jgi:Cys-tRNA synthase (O-phospho-L-seryl-tRNA:Cys-tRNA synthase)